MKDGIQYILYNLPEEQGEVQVVVENETLWCTQKAMAQLFGVGVPAISKHLKNIFDEGELIREVVVSKMEITTQHGAIEDKTQTHGVDFYHLDAIIAVGYRVNSIKATRFRQWATKILNEYIRKGFVMDDERLKNPDGRPDYFDELLERIRDIRASEKRFYQKVRDLFALSSDYDGSDKATQMLFAETQNKLIYAVTNQTAPEIILSRADSSKPNMNLTSWKGKVVRKQDIYISKNYLTEDELDTLNRLVSIFLDTAELRVKMRKTLTLQFWEDNIDKLITDNDFKLLDDKGSRSRVQADKDVEQIYLEFDKRRKEYEAKEADKQDEQELKALEEAEKKLLGRKK